MDFVDLDKVLDQFEEEEKAAGELCPGQESMPSQYPEGQAKQQDITWMTVSYAKQQDITWKSISCSLPSDSNSFKEHHSSLQPSSVYVGPYDIYGGCASSKSIVEFPSPGVEEVTNTRSGHLTSSADCSGQYLAHNGVPTFLPAGDAEQSICPQEQSVQSRLKQGTVESCMGLQLNGSGFEQAQGVEPGKVLELPIKLRAGEENEKRGLIASLPVSVQTDSLSPASEHELMCSPLPRTNILVTGHGETTVKQDGSSGAENESEQMKVSAGDCFSDAQNSEMTGTADSAGVHASLSTVLGEVSCAVDQKLDVAGTLLVAEKVRTHTPHSERQEGGERREIQVDPGLQQNSDDQKMRLGCDEPGVTQKQADKQLSAGELVVTGAVTCQARGEPMVIGFKQMVDIDIDAVKTYLNDLERCPVTDVALLHDQQDSSQAGGVEDTNLCRVPQATPSHPDLDDSVPSSMEGVTEAYSTQQACLQTFPEDETSFTAVKVQDTQEIWDPNACNSSIGGQELCDPCCSDSSVSGQEPFDPNANNSSVSGHNMEVKFCRLNTQKEFDAASEQRINVDTRDGCGSETPESGQNVSGHEVANSFETFSFPTNDSGFSVGKLEIECLLDEILAAKMKSVVQGSGVPGDQTATSENSKALLASHSTVFEEPGVASREAAEHVQLQDNQNGCPAQGMGMGARPKERSQMKRSRPNSLLGLSKISLGGPSAGTQSSQIAAQQMVNGGMAQPSGAGDQVLPLVQGVPTLPVSTGVALTTDSCLTPSPGVGQEVSVPEHQVATSELSGSGVVELDAPVMRRQEAVVVGEAMEASFGGPRPRSWSPSAVASQPAQKLKRPTSLNLPVRQDFSVAGGLSPESSSLQTRKSGAFPEKGSDTCSSEDSVAVGDVDDGKRRQEKMEGLTGAGSEVAMEASRQPILHMNLGRVAPTWVPDGEAPTCMECDARFTFTKRRHHCRACGKVFCSSCCNLKSRLPYLDNKEGRVCIPCHHMLAAAESVRPAGGPCGSPNPNNPTEYCSTVPPTQQASAGAPLPTVMVPTGVLKREGSNKKSEPKQVMFSDGIRPGGDLTELDGSDQAHIPPRRSGRVQKKVERPQGGQSSPKTHRMRGSEGTRNPCLIPEEGLLPVATQGAANGDLTLTENPDLALLMTQIRDEEASPVIFAINRNLLVLVKIINLDCCVHRVVWCFTTQGMANVGQDELVVVLETLPDENTIPRDIFCHFSAVYEEAGKGNKVGHMGHTIFTQQFLDNRSHGGFLYVRASFQCTHKLLLPPPPFLFAVLLQKWETPWAKVFPVRLLLRLGAEYRYYPCPLVSIRNRKPVFYEIGHTIMNLLADFRNFQYMLPQISGVTIHMEDKKTLINFPRNRYQEVMKVVASSNEHVMALGASFSLEADSHLVCIQNEDCNYHTQAINIQNKPRKVTGASFVVFNGALKASAGLRAKSSIVEDGLMVQILPETMAALKQAMKDMVDFSIGCGSASAAQPDELVVVRWVEEDRNVNIGVKSSVDGMSLDGVESIRVHNAADYISDSCAIRWTEVFFIQTESGSSRWEPVDLSHMAETLASATCVALTPQLEQLKQAGLVRIGLRVSLESERVGYEVGSNGECVPDFYMNALDNALIPVIHGAVSSSRDGPIVLELVFHIIN